MLNDQNNGVMDRRERWNIPASEGEVMGRFFSGEKLNVHYTSGLAYIFIDFFSGERGDSHGACFA